MYLNKIKISLNNYNIIFNLLIFLIFISSIYKSHKNIFVIKNCSIFKIQ